MNTVSLCEYKESPEFITNLNYCLSELVVPDVKDI